MARDRSARKRILSALPLLLGALAGTAVASATGAALVQRAEPGMSTALEVIHLPPLLTVDGEAVELRYDAFCVGQDDPELPCDAQGSVFVRPSTGGAYERLALRRDEVADEGEYVATVPAAIGGSHGGFAYYAVFTSERAAATVTLPAGGPDAPQRSVPLERAVAVELGRHAFGAGRPVAVRVAEATWGAGAGQVGLEQGRNLTPIGGASFDVAADGTVHVLDQANRRVLRFAGGAGGPSVPVQMPVPVNGTIADVAVARDGTTYVLETTVGPGGDGPLLRELGPDGTLRASVDVAERAVQVRLGPDETPVVLQHPSGQWMATRARGRLLGVREQRATGRAGRPLRGGGEILVLRHGDELRLALVGPNGMRRSWRLTSRTPLAEVQLAEALGGRLVVVARVYSEEASEFLVLVLDDRGLVRRLALDAAEWAETAPLSRFRLVGSSLYRLGSTPAGLFVDRIDLEVTR